MLVSHLTSSVVECLLKSFAHLFCVVFLLWVIDIFIYPGYTCSIRFANVFSQSVACLHFLSDTFSRTEFFNFVVQLIEFFFHWLCFCVICKKFWLSPRSKQIFSYIFPQKVYSFIEERVVSQQVVLGQLDSHVVCSFLQIIPGGTFVWNQFIINRRIYLWTLLCCIDVNVHL